MNHWISTNLRGFKGWILLWFLAGLLKTIYLIPIHPPTLLSDTASDPAQYISLAQGVSQHILNRPWEFGSRLLFGGMTQQELMAAGLDVESVQNFFRAPTAIGLIALGINVFLYSDEMIWIINILLFGFSAVTFFYLLRSIFSPARALIGYGLFCCYPPFFFMTESALVENVLVVQVVFFFYSLFRLYRLWNFPSALWVGFSLYALVIAKPFFYAWWWPALFIIVIQIVRVLGKRWYISVLGLVLGASFLVLPMKLLVYRTTGQWDFHHPVSTGISRIFQGTAIWNGATLDHDGWHYNHKHDPYFFSVDDSLLTLPKRTLADGRQANYLDVTFYARTCQAAFKNYLRDHYLDYGLEFFKKIGFLLIFPFSAIFHYNNTSWLDGPLNLVLQGTLIVLALFGLGISFRRRLFFLLAWLFIVYHLGIYGLTHIEARFNLTLMPVMMILAWYGVFHGLDYYRKHPPIYKVKPWKIGLTGIGILLLIWLYGEIELSSVYRSSSGFYYTRWIIINGLIVVWLLRLLIRKPVNRLKIGWLGIGILGLFYYNLFTLTAGDQDEYHVGLSSTGQGIVHTIKLGPSVVPGKYEKAHLMIDLKLENNHPTQSYEVYLNQRHIGSIGPSSSRSLGLYYPEDRQIPMIQQYWFNLEFDPRILNPGAENEIRIMAPQNSDNSLVVYGDRANPNGGYQGPGIWILEADKQAVLGVSRFMLNYSDPRIVRSYPLNSTASRSFLIDANGSLHDALPGSLRIRVLLKLPGQYYIRRDFANYLNIWYAYFGYFQLEENEDLIWAGENPGEDYQPINHNLHVYLASKDQLYFTGYDLY